jgi:hypothetical protein
LIAPLSSKSIVGEERPLVILCLPHVETERSQYTVPYVNVKRGLQGAAKLFHFLSSESTAGMSRHLIDYLHSIKHTII